MSDETTPAPAPAATETQAATKAAKVTEKVPVYTAHFQHNNSHELWITGSIVAVFGPYEAKVLDEKIVNHPDFEEKRRQGFFSVTKE